MIFDSLGLIGKWLIIDLFKNWMLWHCNILKHSLPKAGNCDTSELFSINLVFLR